MAGTAKRPGMAAWLGTEWPAKQVDPFCRAPCRADLILLSTYRATWMGKLLTYRVTSTTMQGVDAGICV